MRFSPIKDCILTIDNMSYEYYVENKIPFSEDITTYIKEDISTVDNISSILSANFCHDLLKLGNFEYKDNTYSIKMLNSKLELYIR